MKQLMNNLELFVYAVPISIILSLVLIGIVSTVVRVHVNRKIFNLKERKK